jgi:lipid-binding SYLF domain-containing protein
MIRILGIVAAGALVASCAGTPKTSRERTALELQAADTLARMESRDPALRPVLNRAAGYVVFPQVTEAGLLVGGGGGRGVVYEHGRPVGFAELRKGSVGAEAGAQTYAEVVVVRDRFTLEKMKRGEFDFGTQASAVIVRSGAAAASRFDNGVAVFVQPQGGAMLNLSLTGQRIKFTG